MSDVIPNAEELLEYASSESQKEAIRAVLQHGSYSAASRHLGINRTSVQDRVNRARAQAAKQGWSPEHDMIRTVPDGFSVKGVSTLYGADGGITAQWVKSSIDRERQEEIIREVYASMAADLPRANPVPAPKKTTRASQSLLNLFTITDYHMGMLAWHKETGADWDLNIAEDMLYRVFEQMLDRAPHARVAVVNQLGDFLHTDGLEAKTPLHGFLLDADGRFPKIVAAAVRTLRRIVDLALETHEEVHVVLAEGNHDIVSSIWLRELFGALYEKEPRVTVNDAVLPYYIYPHGETLLGFHHGHLSRNESLPALFAAKFRKEWGEATRTYIHTGHRHHQHVKEHPGALVIQHATLSAPDAYAARGGWISERQAKCITYHSQFGEVGSLVVTPEMVDS